MAQVPPLSTPIWFDRNSPPHILTLVAIAGVATVGMNMFLPSLPAMADHFGTSYGTMQLAVSAYLAATGVLQLAIGPLSDRFGRRPVLLWGMAVFTLASVACALAPTAEIFLVCRLVQAVVASGIVLSRAIVRDMVEPDAAASMIGYVTMGMALVPMVAPMLGGVLEEWFGWQAVFLAMAVFGMLGLGLVWSDLGETNRHRSTSFAAQVAAYPALFRSRRFWGYAATAAFASGAFFAFLGGGPYVSTVFLGLGPAEVGFYFGFIALGYMVGNFLSGRYATRVGINRMMLWGGLVTTLGLVGTLGLFWAGQISALVFFGAMLFVGVGNGMLLPCANAGIVSVRPHLAGSASGLGGALMIGGGAAIAQLAGVLLGPETGPWPLVWLMLACTLLGLATTIYVIAVARSLGARN